MVQLSHLYMTTGKTIALIYGPLMAKWCLCFLIHCYWATTNLFYISINFMKCYVNRIIQHVTFWGWLFSFSIMHLRSGLDEQSRIKTAGRNINNLRYADDTILMAESKEELKSLLMKVKEESEKAGLKLNIQKTKIMASGPITSWEIDGETMETVTDFTSWAPKITADGDSSHEIKRRLLLGRKAVTNVDSILKSRDKLLCQQRSI